MNTNIHPTAFIEPGAQLGTGVRVGPFCVVGAHVKLGDNVVLHSHVVIAGHTTIGAGTQIYPFASLGSPPQDLKYKGEPGELIVGSNNVIREHATMNIGTAGGGMKTIVGDNGLYMTATHVAHDCVVGDHVIMANNATLGGHVVLGHHVVIGGLAGVHQFIRIGDFAVVGGVTAVDTDIIPYGRAKGDRASLMGLNLIGLERGGYAKDAIKTLQRAYNQLFADEGTLEDRMNQVEQDFASEASVQEIIHFARGKSRFPLCQPPRKGA